MVGCIPVRRFGRDMDADFKIEWSNRARNDLDSIYQFILKQWTVREAEAMLDIVQEFEHLVSVSPLIFKKSPTIPQCHLATLHRNLTAVYQFDGKTVFIITLFDNRMDDLFR
jgi:plasmid stabilization system protein ParE